MEPLVLVVYFSSETIFGRVLLVYSLHLLSVDESTVTAEQQQFRDKFVFYRFFDDVDANKEPLRKPPPDVARDVQNKKEEVLTQLIQLAPDAVLKAILKKP